MPSEHSPLGPITGLSEYYTCCYVANELKVSVLSVGINRGVFYHPVAQCTITCYSERQGRANQIKLEIKKVR